MFATRLEPATFAGIRAKEGAPYYHDECVPVDAQGFALPDTQGRTRVWWSRLYMVADETCATCGKALEPV
jgi:hypothetical protein